MHWVYPRRVKVGLFIADLVIAILAMLASYGALSLRRISTWQMIVVSLLFALMFASFYYIFDLYDLSKRARIGIWYRFSAAVAMDVLAMCALLALLPGIFRGRAWVFAAIGLAGAASMILRVIYRVRSRDYVERFPAVIIGSAQDARALVACVPDESHLRFIGYFGESDRTTPMEIAGARNRASFPLHAAGLASCELDECGERAIVECRYLGRIEPDRVRKVVAAGAVQFLVVNSRFISAEVGALLTELRFRGVRIYSVPDFCMRLSEELPLELLSDEWLTFAGGFDLLESRMLRRLKRLSDLLLAAAAITLTLPLMVLTAIAVKLDSPGPALFSQTRVGWKGREFRLLKFRSMRQNAEANGAQWAQRDDPRTTRLGKWIRKFRVDELPQLFNVLAGQMSFVGPRPERPEFVRQLEREIPYYQLRHYLPPGITGWAQVKYPYGASVEDARRKLQFDLYYIRNASPIVDARILLRTVRTVLFLQGSR